LKKATNLQPTSNGKEDFVMRRLIIVTIALLIALLIYPFENGVCEAKQEIKMEPKKIYGTIVRPNLTVIMQRSKFTYEAMKEKKSFLDRIVDSLRNESFKD